jgi:hypothetical protein
MTTIEKLKALGVHANSMRGKDEAALQSMLDEKILEVTGGDPSKKLPWEDQPLNTPPLSTGPVLLTGEGELSTTLEPLTGEGELGTTLEPLTVEAELGTGSPDAGSNEGLLNNETASTGIQGYDMDKDLAAGAEIANGESVVAKYGFSTPVTDAVLVDGIRYQAGDTVRVAAGAHIVAGGDTIKAWKLGGLVKS